MFTTSYASIYNNHVFGSNSANVFDPNAAIVFGPNSTIEFGPILAYLITQLLPPSSSYSVRDSGSKYGL